VNERGAASAYRRLAQLEPHPALAPLLKRIAAQESRHIAFYTTQATKRLGDSKLARAFTRFALSKVWGPVGSTIEPEEEVRFVMGYLFDGPDGLREVRKMDEAIAKLPGMQGLTVNENAFRARGLYTDLPAAA